MRRCSLASAMAALLNWPLMLWAVQPCMATFILRVARLDAAIFTRVGHDSLMNRLSVLWAVMHYMATFILRVTWPK